MRAGDAVIEVNGCPVEAELDFVFHAATTDVSLLVVRRGALRRFDLVREGGQSLGLSFVPVPVRRCRNRCVFCFIDQLPSGLRRSLYVKDEDFRHSFLYGNFVTLTGLRDSDIDRIVSMRLSPLYVSVHATDHAVRNRLLGNARAPDIVSQLRELGRCGIRFHTQVVVCPGLNDGPVLRRTLRDLLALGDPLMSIGVVPVGLTRFRRTPLAPVTAQRARAIVGALMRASDGDRSRTGVRRVFPADELLLKAGHDIPPASFYEEYPQIENGIGLVRTFLDDLEGSPRAAPGKGDRRRGTTVVVTGVSAYPFVRDAVERLTTGAADAVTLAVPNRFFGESVTVAGLLCARDVLRELRGLHPRRIDTVVLPASMFNDRGYTLDSYSPRRISREGGCRVRVAATTVELRGCAKAGGKEGEYMSDRSGLGTPVRINRYLAQCGLGSRRACERLVTAGRVYLNGRRITDLATTVDPSRDTVEYKGKELRPVRRLEYVAYHKPAGPVVTRRDPQGRQTVYDDIATTTRRDVGHLRYVGRLDRDSEGLLLLTNDGDLVHALTHPRFHVKKIYHVRTDRPLEPRHGRTMVDDGVVSAGDRLHAGRVVALEMEAAGKRRFWYEVHLYEGKNRQIRRMFEAFGYRVERLIRVRFSSVKLGDLPPHRVRPLTEREIKALRNVGYRQGGER